VLSPNALSLPVVRKVIAKFVDDDFGCKLWCAQGAGDAWLEAAEVGVAGSDGVIAVAAVSSLCVWVVSPSTVTQLYRP
jgi:hypothetical protein